MKENEIITIHYGGKDYKIIKSKLIFVISKLTNRNVNNESELLSAMKQFELYDSYFLENINSI